MEAVEKARHQFEMLGLTQYEARALAAIFANHDCTADDISKDADVPYTKIYAVLTSLEKQGILKSTLERPKRYRALEPQTVISILIKKRENEIKEMRQATDIKFLSRFYDEGNKTDSNEKVWYFSTKLAVINEIIRQIRECKEELCSLADGAIWKEIFESEEAGKIASETIFPSNCIGRHIIPTSYEPAFDKIPSHWLKYFLGKNYELRLINAESIQNNTIILDKKLVSTSFRGPNGEITSGMTIQDPQIVKGALNHFNTLWNIAVPIENKIREKAKQQLESRRKNSL